MDCQIVCGHCRLTSYTCRFILFIDYIDQLINILCEGCNQSLLSIGYLLYQNNEIISYISYWRIISLLLHYVSLVDRLIIESNIVLFMVVLIEISIKVVFSELVSKTVGLSSTLFPIQIVKQSINWLIFFFETPF